MEPVYIALIVALIAASILFVYGCEILRRTS